MTGRPLTDVQPPVPPLQDGDPPIALPIDYDGTISLTDVTDEVMAAHVPGVWEEAAARYDAGLMGSRRLMTWEIDLVRADPAAMLARGWSITRTADGALVREVADAPTDTVLHTQVADGVVVSRTTDTASDEADQ